MSATSHRRATKEIVEALAAAAAGIVLPGSNPPVKAFGRVELFDSEDVTEAFRFLTITDQRVCVIVPLDERFEPELAPGGLKFVWKRRLPVMALVSDRVMGDRRAALWGDGDKEIGAMGLAELCLPALSGLILEGVNKVIAEPQSMSPMSVKNTERDLPGRVTVGLEFECRGGWLETRLEKGPVF